jgi:hypothetical protein
VNVQVAIPLSAQNAEEVYEFALSHVRPAAALREAAAAFDRIGCEKEARRLRARADLCEAPAAVHEERRRLIQPCLDSRDPVACEALADEFEELGMVTTMREMRAEAGRWRSAATTGSEA